MTIIESFEKAPIDNIISALESHADKIIFLGEMMQMEKPVSVYCKLLKMKGIESKIVLKDISKNDLDSILEVLTEIVESESDCIFDITGGEDLVLLGFGIIYERYRDRKSIKLQRFDISTEDYPLDVKELISLYGGIVIPEEPQPTVSNALEEVDKLWDLARVNSSKWNRSNSYLKELERKGECSYDALEMYLNLKEVKTKINQYELKFREAVELLENFEQAGLVELLEIGHDTISYKYKL